MDRLIKNLDYAAVIKLADQVEYLKGQVVSKTLVQNPAVGLTLFAIPENEGISAHKSTGDAFVYIIEGKCEITIEEEKFHLGAGECIVMPKGKPHTLFGTENFKMLLVVIFPTK